MITRPATKGGKPVYLLTYSANNFEAEYYGVGFATAESPLGPFRKSSKNPVLSQEPDGKVPIYSTGHGSIVPSPPRHGSRVGAQEVTLDTPAGSELFYVHHARNSTDNNRSIYTTRMTLDSSAMYFKSNDALSMHLTPLDESLPKNTYPVSIDVFCFKSGYGEEKIHVRVSSKQGAGFDIEEGTNRIVALPDDVTPASVTENGKEGSSWVIEFDSNKVKEIVYQRQMLDGSWSTVAGKSIKCH